MRPISEKLLELLAAEGDNIFGRMAQELLDARRVVAAVGHTGAGNPVPKVIVDALKAYEVRWGHLEADGSVPHPLWDAKR